MRIGELARRTGVSTRALRYYEEQNLLTAERSNTGQRHYPETAVARILLVRELFTAGLSSKTIAELTPCVIDGKATPELLDRLAVERGRIDQHIADLTHTRDRLDSVIAGASASMDTGTPCRPGPASTAPAQVSGATLRGIKKLGKVGDDVVQSVCGALEQ